MFALLVKIILFFFTLAPICLGFWQGCLVILHFLLLKLHAVKSLKNFVTLVAIGDFCLAFRPHHGCLWLVWRLDFLVFPSSFFKIFNFQIRQKRAIIVFRMRQRVFENWVVLFVMHLVNLQWTACQFDTILILDWVKARRDVFTGLIYFLSLFLRDLALLNLDRWKRVLVFFHVMSNYFNRLRLTHHTKYLLIVYFRHLR